MPYTTGRPTSVSSPTGGWTATSGGSLADDSDTSYWSYVGFGTLYNDPLKATIASLAMAPQFRLRYLIVNVRMAYPTGSPLPNMKATLLSQGVPLVANAITITATPTTYGVVALVDVANITPAQLAALEVWVEENPFFQNPFAAQPAPVPTRVYEIIVTAYWATAPTSILSAPSGTITTTSSPIVAWTYYAGNDGSGQAAYQIKVFNDTAYTAGSFDPNTSTPTYDSGVVYSGATMVPVGPLPNATYRAYVRVAQLVNGQLHWDTLWSWRGFVENVSPPSAPTVTATAVSSDARIDLAISGSGNALSVLDVYEVQRTSDGGVTWESVRGDAGQYIQVLGATRAWADYESDNGELVQYRARTLSTTTDGFTYISSWSSTTTATSWSSSSTWLKVPGKQHLNRVIVVQSFGNDERSIPQAIGQGLGSRYATVQSGLRRALADGTLTIYCASAAERTALETILDEPVLLVQPKPTMVSWGGRYIVPGKASAARAWGNGGWIPDRAIELPYTQIQTPSSTAYPAETGDVTWAQLMTTFATISAATGTWAANR